MKAILIITIFALQPDGSITRQRDILAQDSMEACKVESVRRGVELATAEGPKERQIAFQCAEVSVLEVVKPAPNKKPAIAPQPSDRVF
jgi:hypothetical protein